MITKIFFQVSSTPYFCKRKRLTRNSFVLPNVCVCFKMSEYVVYTCKLGFVISNMIKDFDPLVSSVKECFSVLFLLTLSVSLSALLASFMIFTITLLNLKWNHTEASETWKYNCHILVLQQHLVLVLTPIPPSQPHCIFLPWPHPLPLDVPFARLLNTFFWIVAVGIPLL